MKRIKKAIDINASKEKIWSVLTDDKYTSDWYREFSEGTKAETDWKVGSKAIFTDNSASGLISIVTIHQPNEVLTMEYQGIVMNGQEDYSGDLARQIKGGIESYRLIDNGSAISLAIESDMGDEHYEYMSGAWGKALEKVKLLSEAK